MLAVEKKERNEVPREEIGDTVFGRFLRQAVFAISDNERLAVTTCGASPLPFRSDPPSILLLPDDPDLCSGFGVASKSPPVNNPGPVGPVTKDELAMREFLGRETDSADVAILSAYK